MATSIEPGEYNTFSDIRYKLHLRFVSELELTNSMVAPDNPRRLTEAEVAAFTAYRAARYDIAHGSIDNMRTNEFAEMLLQGLEYPEFPEGWRVVTRSVGDLPPIICKIDHLDVYDATLEREEGEFTFTITEGAGEPGARSASAVIG